MRINRFVLLASLLFATPVAAQIDQDPTTEDLPQTLHYEGSITLQGRPFDGELAMRFHLFGGAQDQEELWTSEWSAQAQGAAPVSVRNGRFRVNLGRYVGIPDAVWDRPSVYLMISVEMPETGEWVRNSGAHRISTAPVTLWSRMARNLDADRVTATLDTIVDQDLSAASANAALVTVNSAALGATRAASAQFTGALSTGNLTVRNDLSLPDVGALAAASFAGDISTDHIYAGVVRMDQGRDVYLGGGVNGDSERGDGGHLFRVDGNPSVPGCDECPVPSLTVNANGSFAGGIHWWGNAFTAGNATMEGHVSVTGNAQLSTFTLGRSNRPLRSDNNIRQNGTINMAGPMSVGCYLCLNYGDNDGRAADRRFTCTPMSTPDLPDLGDRKASSPAMSLLGVVDGNDSFEMVFVCDGFIHPPQRSGNGWK